MQQCEGIDAPIISLCVVRMSMELCSPHVVCPGILERSQHRAYSVTGSLMGSKLLSTSHQTMTGTGAAFVIGDFLNPS